MEKREKKNNESWGVSGFTLAIAGYFSLLFTGIFTLVYFIVGLIFCSIQQKRKETKLGKIGLILNAIGIIATIALVLVIVVYIYPWIQDQYNFFPSA